MFPDRKVFIINRGLHDYSPAEKYGELVFLTEERKYVYNISTLAMDFSKQMQDSKWYDILLLSGTGSMCGVACAVFAVKHTCLNILVWSHQNNAYHLRTTNLATLIGRF